jgi:hypothetical protein
MAGWLIDVHSKLVTPHSELTCCCPCLQLLGHSTTARSHGRSVAVFTLADTASLWQYGGPSTNTSAPLLVAQAVHLEAPPPPVTGLPLRQPQGAQPLQLGTRPRGFWNGAVRLGLHV